MRYYDTAVLQAVGSGMLNETVIFRASDELVEAIGQAARAAGLSISEYLRRIAGKATGAGQPAEPEWVF